MRVNVDTKAFTDPRFFRLGTKLKMNRHEALGRCLLVWSVAYENRSPITTAADIDAAADLNGFSAAMIAADLAQNHRGKVRLRGIVDRVHWLIGQDRKREKANETRRAKQKSSKTRHKPDTQSSSERLPGGNAPGLPSTPYSLLPDPDPSPPPEGREERRGTGDQERADSTLISPVGWTPPARVLQLAEKLVREGKQTPEAIAAFWLYADKNEIREEKRLLPLLRKWKLRENTADRVEPSSEGNANWGSPW